MPGQSVIPRSRNLRGAGTAFIHNPLYLTRDKPYSRLARRCGLFLCSLLATTISAFCGLPASAGTLIADISPEGFSVSSEGLPEFAMDAWYATVRVEGRGVAWPPGKCPRLRMRRGSGIVVKLKNEGRMAVVATNAHIITCAYGACEIRVGFGDSSSPDGTKWSNAVHIVSREASERTSHSSRSRYRTAPRPAPPGSPLRNVAKQVSSPCFPSAGPI